MNEENVDDDKVFQMTKLIYQEMKARWDQNYIGDKASLQKFRLESLEPLYPTKQNMQNNELNIEQASHQTYNQQQQARDQETLVERQNAGSENNYEKNSAESDADVNKYSLKQLCVYLGVGNFLCWKSYPPDPVYEDLGLSVCLYLKFMKHLVLTLFILAVLPVMQIVFFYSIAQSNNFDPSSNYQKSLFAMTIGSLSLEGIKCAHQTLSGVKTYSFQLSCPIGQVRVLGPVYSSSKVVSLRSCKEDINNFLDSSKFNIKQNQFTQTTTDCNSELATCTYQIALNSQDKQFTDLSVTYQCINGKSKFGATDLSRSTALICSIIFDLLFTVGMVIFYWSQTHAETKQKAYFKSKQLMLNQFTLQIGYFSKHNFQSEFELFLANLQSIIKAQTGFEENLQSNIVQVRLPENSQFAEALPKKQKRYEKLYKLIGKYFIDRKKDVSSYRDLDEFISFGFNFDYQFDEYKKKLFPLLNKYTIEQRRKIQAKQEQIKIFIVFSKPKVKRLILECTETKDNTKYLKFNQGKQYMVRETLAPALVAWNNMNKTNKLWRNILSWTITILLIGLTYVLIAFMLWQRDNLLKNYDFNIDCKTIYPDNSYSFFDQGLSQQNANGYTHCYCISKSIFVFINNDPNCSSWTWQYTLYLFIPIIFSVAIVIINTIVSAIYRALSQFEAHTYLTSQLYSYIIKKSLLLILNMALIIIVLSIDTKTGNTDGDFSFLFQGRYNDITADWYLEVGLFILLTLIFNTFSPCIESIVFFVMSIVKKFLISSFKKKPSHFKLKSNYMEFYRGEILPIEQRYAIIMAIFAITFCLNFVFPLLTLIFLVTMFLLQLNDKVLIIKGYQKPINFGNELHSKFIKSLIIILLIHLAITSVLITEPFLLVAGITTLNGSITQVNRNRFQAFFQTGYVIPYALLFVMVLITFCVSFGAKLYERTKPNEKVDLGLDGIPYEEHKFYHLLKKYELLRTLTLKKREIKRIKFQQKTKQNRQAEEKLYDDFKAPPALESSININVKEEYVVDNKNASKQESILLRIAKLNLEKLQSKLKQDIPDRERIVKLNGMTVYDWHKDWVFFDEHLNPNFEIPGLNQLIQTVMPPQAIIGQQGKIFNYVS